MLPVYKRTTSNEHISIENLARILLDSDTAVSTSKCVLHNQSKFATTLPLWSILMPWMILWISELMRMVHGTVKVPLLLTLACTEMEELPW